MKTTKIELLAPARDYDTAVTAIRYGADAVYIGAPDFGARAAAGNSIEDIARLVKYAHRFGVRVYVTMNTILYDTELEQAERTAREVTEAGADALIVQDAAYLRMGLHGVELHSSTQMHITTPDEAQFWYEAGCTRVVLERAMSLDEIRAVCEGTEAEVECFVHGAICVGYSGRCFLSRSMSDRSGNRGECSQPCRLTWDLCDERGRELLKGKHLLSVRDLNLSRHVSEMIDAGVRSFKIEGRLKGADYIQNIVAYYRGVIDKAISARKGLSRSSWGESAVDFVPSPEKSFLRGETDFFYSGVRSGVASFDTPKSIGAEVGKIGKIGRGWFCLTNPRAELSSGDGVCWLSDGVLRGTNINSTDGARVYPNRTEGLTEGAVLYRNYDSTFAKELERSRTRRTLDIDARVELSSERVVLTYTDERGVCAVAAVEGQFEPAENRERMLGIIRVQAAKTGDTIFNVRDTEITGDVVFVPSGVLADLRRRVLSELDSRLADMMPPHVARRENLKVRYPQTVLDGSYNVVNSLARKFYTDHGVESIERGWDSDEFQWERAVMTSRYCLRRELGWCFKDNPEYKGGLWLEHGAFRYRLDFDCRRCEMKLIAEQRCKD